MSIERVERDGGVVWRVRWREAGRNRSKVVGRKRDAELFDAELRRRRRMGELARLDSDEPLAEFAEEWWRVHAVPHLSPTTRKTYASLWDRHVHPRLGSLALAELAIEVVQRFAADLATEGVGPAARRKTLALLGGVLQRAVEWGRISSNPVRTVRMPPARAERRTRPLAPATVEAIRAGLLRDGRQRDATLVSVLAYAGLRPGEALALRWSDVSRRTLLIERAVADGATKPTKTGQTRSVRLLKPLADDLELWRLASEPPSTDALVFPAASGGAWVEHDWRNWRAASSSRPPSALAWSAPGPTTCATRSSACSSTKARPSSRSPPRPATPQPWRCRPMRT